MGTAIILAGLTALDSFNKALVSPAGQTAWAANNALVASIFGKLDHHITPVEVQVAQAAPTQAAQPANAPIAFAPKAS